MDKNKKGFFAIHTHDNPFKGKSMGMIQDIGGARRTPTPNVSLMHVNNPDAEKFLKDNVKAHYFPMVIYKTKLAKILYKLGVRKWEYVRKNVSVFPECSLIPNAYADRLKDVKIRQYVDGHWDVDDHTHDARGYSEGGI